LDPNLRAKGGAIFFCREKILTPVIWIVRIRHAKTLRSVKPVKAAAGFVGRPDHAVVFAAPVDWKNQQQLIFFF
jgi:hypothetical protein